MANNQLAERWVKDSNECTYTGKDEKMSNLLAIVQSCTIFAFNDDAYDVHIDRRQKEKKITSGKIGERIHLQTNIVESQNNRNKRDQVRGILMINYIINERIKIQKQINALKLGDDIQTAIYSYLDNKEKQFKTIQQNEELGSL